MNRLSDLVLISDMDGTLLDCRGEVPLRNVEAIRRFVQKGGRFGIATGRSRALMLDIVEELPITAPCVLYNGGEVYDVARQKILHQSFLPEGSEEYLQTICRAFPDIGVFVVEGDMYCHVQQDSLSKKVFQSRDKRYLARCSLAEVPGPWYKALFIAEPAREQALQDFVRTQNFAGVRFVASSEYIVEMLPAANNKARALSYLLDAGLLQREHLVVVGDYYNDLEMIALAGLGVTLSSAPADIQAKADIVVGDNDHGAVADVIEYLEQHSGA